MTEPDDTWLLSQRREFVIACSSAGNVSWRDAVAKGRFGLAVGQALTSIAAPGSSTKLQSLLDAAWSTDVVEWEVGLLANNLPTTCTLRTERKDDLVWVFGTMLTQDVASALGQVNETLSELANLHRQTERQQRELLRRNEELRRLNRELDDSAKGLLALHAEVDEKNDSIRRLAEVKSRVVSNVSHEFRTPLNSIIGLTKMLVARTDGELTSEQEKQLGFILRSAESLVELVNDLLDLSKMEAGKVSFRPVKFRLNQLFAALRGMSRPLVTNETVTLEIDEVEGIDELETDEGKVSQVLKNFISNALKFTESGRVRLSASIAPNDWVNISVSDTGIGIAPADQARVFEEFTQLDSPLQRKTRGTGLGLSLARRIADILGGRVSVESSLGKGSTFTLSIPRVHPEVREMTALIERSAEVRPDASHILVVEDDRQTLFLYERYLRGAGFQVIPARSIDDARVAMTKRTPAAVVLDVMLEGETSWSFLEEMKSSPRTRDIPILVVTVTNREEKARALGADEFFVKPVDPNWLLRKLTAMSKRNGAIHRVLIVDDDEVSRYMLRRSLEDSPYEVLEAPDGEEGIRLARERLPQVIFLDFVMPGMNAFDVLDELKVDPRTRDIPVIIHTSKNLADAERNRLAAEAASILPKQSLNRELAIGRIRDALLKAGVMNPLGGTTGSSHPQGKAHAHAWQVVHGKEVIE